MFLSINISIKKQTLTILLDNKLIKSYSISSALKGIGQNKESFKTPIGIHYIRAMIGKDLPIFSIFEGRRYTGKIWTKDVEKLNLSLWDTTKKFVDEKINEINKKLYEADAQFLLRDLSMNKKESGADNNLNVFLDSYRYILNLEYLRSQEEPMIVMVRTEIIDNTWNRFFTKFYNIIILDLVFSLSLFVFLYAFSNKRNK